MTPRGGGRASREMMPWSQAVTLSSGPKPSRKEQDWNVKTRFSAIPLTQKKKPSKAPVLLHLDNHRGHFHLYFDERHPTQLTQGVT